METPDDLAMPFLLAEAFRGLADAVHADLEAAGYPGVTERHGFAMQAIGEGCSGAELGQRLGVSKQAAAKTAASLEALGLIERAPDPLDRRASVLSPTERGRGMLRASAASFRRHVAEWRARSGDAAMDATLRTLALAEPGRRGPVDAAGRG